MMFFVLIVVVEISPFSGLTLTWGRHEGKTLEKWKNWAREGKVQLTPVENMMVSRLKWDPGET